MLTVKMTGRKEKDDDTYSSFKLFSYCSFSKMYTYTMMENTMDTSLRMIKLNKITYSHIVAYQYEFSVSFLRFVIPD